MVTQYQRGAIYWLSDLANNTGSEQTGARPCLIISNTANNVHSPVVTIATITTKTKTKLPVHVAIPNISGHKTTDTVLCEQIKTVAKNRLTKFCGILHPTLMQKVDKALRIQLGLNDFYNYSNEYKLQFLKDAETLTNEQLAKKYEITAKAALTRKFSWAAYFKNKNK